MNNKKNYILILVCALFNSLNAQTGAKLTNYVYTKEFYNPSYTASNGGSNAFLLVRQQWLGFEGAPGNQMFSINTSVPHLKSGVGLSFLNDVLGGESSQNIQANYSYTVKAFAGETFIHFGLSTGLSINSLRASEFVYEQQDPNGLYENATKVKPAGKMGINFSSKNITTGASVEKAFGTIENHAFKAPFYYHVELEYWRDLTKDIEMLASAYFHKTNYVAATELNLFGIYQNKFWAGAAYRYKISLNSLFGVVINNKFKIGYSFDLPMGQLQTYLSGSHEIFLSIVLKDPSKTHFYYKSPRFF
ncbi:MAG: PorP/SprF family type IX secretion system membrane protein [Bacteroidales bacterium]|nr:PorP/SprF family type IX secretion system membrane protein [Bacteroidales bacterium]